MTRVIVGTLTLLALNTVGAAAEENMRVPNQNVLDQRTGHILFPGGHGPYGFTDSIQESGGELFCSARNRTSRIRVCDAVISPARGNCAPE
jgi:hypothetical protein